jgi:manganese/zinc/iron transport system substrate-binding protein
MGRFLVLFAALGASLALVVAVSSSGCTSTSNRGSVEGRKIHVVSTVGMIADAAANVGGERVQAEALMGPGIDPHLYRATAGDVKKLEGADVIFYGGLELEGRMTDIFVKMAGRGIRTVAVSEKAPPDQLREPPEFAGKYDPHIWFDVMLWKTAVEAVRDELSSLDPGSADLYKANAEKYLAQLDELDAYVKGRIQEIPKERRMLVTAHDAFGYFGRRYGMEVLGIQGTSTAAEASAETIRRLAGVIAERKIPAIFVESSVPKGTIEALQKAVQARGWQIRIGGQLFSDAMGKAGTPEGTYIGMVRHNVDTMAEALR